MTQTPDTDSKTYKIVRFFQDDRPTEVITRGQTLEQAQEHCQRADTHGDGWFDGYESEAVGPFVKCRECDRVFDLSNPVDSDEWANGHDCEAS